jgi:sortase A
VRILIRSVGELCITAGLVLLLFVAYELWGTGRYTKDQQESLSQELEREWGSTVTTEKVKLGGGLALIRIPRLGQEYRYVIVEGVSLADLRKGPGHYPGTAMPGRVGNFVLSGHRTTYAAPFNRIGELRKGDQILVDTRTKQYVYTVANRKIIQPTATEAIAPVPFRPRADPTKPLISLTTCHPKYSAAQRLVVYGELARALPRVRGRAS